MKSRKIYVIAYSTLLLSLLFVVIAYFYYTPQRTLVKIREAAEKGDTETLSELVDFPSVRQSIKDEFNSMMAQEMAKESSNPYAALGMMMASAFADRFVDSMVTPSSISAFTKGIKPNKNSESRNYDNNNGNTINNNLNKNEKYMRYDGFSKYIIEFKDKDNMPRGIMLVMRRQGLNWKLTAIRFPKPTGE